MQRMNARPEPLDVDLQRSAVIVVDMQNAFASKGGMLDLAGFDISEAPRVIERIRVMLEKARARAIPVVYLQVGYKPDQSNGGGADSPNPRKELGLRMMAERPELRGKLVTEGTWDFAIVDELVPQPGDLVIVKTRYSGFAGTNLDSELRQRGIRYLFFTGIATNVCVESTLRDAFFNDYWPILIVDAAAAAGDPGMHEASVKNIEAFFGWTMQTAEFIENLQAATRAVSHA